MEVFRESAVEVAPDPAGEIIRDPAVEVAREPVVSIKGEVGGEVGEGRDLARLTVRELKAMASEKKVRGYSRLKKAELAEVLG